ncbi:MAG TPA: M14 family zinc carboxypeptidase, partial [Lacibacter sp.]|nr:M14 family zinc carboxypeptidase [Lacibacter sp.]
MKQLLAAGFFFLLTLAGSAQVMSPEQFLGYPLGSRYTPHHKIVAYVQHVAAQSPQMVRLEQYGVTNEHRPLLALFVSAPENIRRLEEIRLNNLRLASLLPDKAAATEETPVIVWLSYNVHGNETSSSEAALMTLYALVDPSNTKTREWLRNTVVVMDPCINPDGRDRYINWYNSVLGVQPTARMDAREHREPWPGGRTNHYNFDLNRDWAWQTQVESRQRLVLYNKWMPQIHVDYHEQGINSPYYFAPAAEPYHEVITPWQRSFQETIGRNH